MSGDAQNSGSPLRGFKRSSNSKLDNVMKKGITRIGDILSSPLAKNPRGNEADSVFSQGIRELDSSGYEKFNLEGGSEIYISMNPGRTFINDGEPILVRGTNGNYIGSGGVDHKAPKEEEKTCNTPIDVKTLFPNVTVGTGEDSVIYGTCGINKNGSIETAPKQSSFVSYEDEPIIEKINTAQPNTPAVTFRENPTASAVEKTETPAAAVAEETPVIEEVAPKATTPIRFTENYPVVENTVVEKEETTMAVEVVEVEPVMEVAEPTPAVTFTENYSVIENVVVEKEETVEVVDAEPAVEVIVPEAPVFDEGAAIDAAIEQFSAAAAVSAVASAVAEDEAIVEAFDDERKRAEAEAEAERNIAVPSTIAYAGIGGNAISATSTEAVKMDWRGENPTEAPLSYPQSKAPRRFRFDGGKLTNVTVDRRIQEGPRSPLD